MTALYVLDVPEHEALIGVVERDLRLAVGKVGPYFRIAPDEGSGAGADVEIDRRTSGCRHAVWYSVVAGTENAKVVQHDKDALRLAPEQ